MTRPDLLDLSNCALLYVYDSDRTAVEAYRRYRDYVSGQRIDLEQSAHREQELALQTDAGE